MMMQKTNAYGTATVPAPDHGDRLRLAALRLNHHSLQAINDPPIRKTT